MSFIYFRKEVNFKGVDLHSELVFETNRSQEK